MSTRGLSLDDFLALNGIPDQRIELIDGHMVEKAGWRWGHGRLVIEIGYLLKPFGFASVEPRAIIPGNHIHADNSPLPDLAFYRSNPPGPNDWMRTPPDVALEVLSPEKGRRETEAKVDAYLRFGVRSVWVFDVQRESVDIYEGETRRTLGATDTLTTPVVPGLSIELQPLFDRVLRR